MVVLVQKAASSEYAHYFDHNRALGVCVARDGSSDW